MDFNKNYKDKIYKINYKNHKCKKMKFKNKLN